MGITLYKLDASAPVRSVYMVLKALDVPSVEYVDVNLLRGEHLTEEFLKINPQHTVPTLVDDDIVVWDSHAISCYLVQKYGQDDVLYPSDPKKRAIVDQRLYFDSGTLFPALRGAVVSEASLFACAAPTGVTTPTRLLHHMISVTKEPLLFWGTTSIKAEAQVKIKSAYVLAEKLLSSPWIAGEELTLADICCVATISSLDVVMPIDGNMFPDLHSWLGRCSALDIYKTGNEPGLNQFKALITSRLSA